MSTWPTVHPQFRKGQYTVPLCASTVAAGGDTWPAGPLHSARVPVRNPLSGLQLTSGETQMTSSYLLNALPLPAPCAQRQHPAVPLQVVQVPTHSGLHAKGGARNGTQFPCYACVGQHTTTHVC